MNTKYKIVGNKTLTLSHRGYSCIAHKYTNGCWGFGNGANHQSEFQPYNDYPYIFFYFADDVDEANERFAWGIDRMIKTMEDNKKEYEWARCIDYNSIMAVCNILPDKFLEIITSDSFDRGLMQAVKGGDYEVPLYYVTKVWDILLKNSMGELSYLIGPEEDDDFDDNLLRSDMQQSYATRTRWEAISDNNKMKTIWKDYLKIDLDKVDIDFSVFDMHMYPKVSNDDQHYYFWDTHDGLNEWILQTVILPNSYVYANSVSGLMEFVNFLNKEYLCNEETVTPDIDKWRRVSEYMRAHFDKYPHYSGETK